MQELHDEVGGLPAQPVGLLRLDEHSGGAQVHRADDRLPVAGQADRHASVDRSCELATVDGAGDGRVVERQPMAGDS